MKRFLSYLATPIFHLYFGSLLLLFHPIMAIGLKLFGDSFRKKIVDILNLLLTKGLAIMGAKVRYNGLEKIPENRPLIIIANHQSTYDIPPIVWAFRKHYPRFISKIELAKNIPSISHNLKHGKSALIDRKKGAQSVKEIFKLGKLIEANNQAACIFPEGTRTKTGKVKKFMTGGVHTLLRAAPSAIIVPFAIEGHYELTKNKRFPYSFGQQITYTILDPIDPKDYDVEEVILKAETEIKKTLGQYQPKAVDVGYTK
ncbi:1-acyl-sn-glycerol-3-phosphate acyltransferase [Marinilabiliaceae bacterium JC017]|nr:1-acyl-sn-glycerol-3-phosphate acyltransferase [Marinilabiliaceae bacterium JC017]